ncbi:unnamed protein product [Cercopithifilaria johnstoni]|uniref:Uncharacterized protein n=1 Tax=Cercopithifilaria johnstoni TaxID=2874296 RepID=A0A8J2MIA1_9BILA|nr:unnamed protein product [Cercopithifilaria johnstoni]
MPKSRKKKNAITVLVPEKPTANLTSAMRTELYATPETFENAIVQTSSNIIPEKSEASKKAKIPQIATKKEILKKPGEEISKSNVMITKINDMQIYDADLIGTYSQSSGTVSYDSIKSVNNKSLEQAKSNGKYIQNTDNKLHKVVIEQLLDDSSSIAKMRVISDSELNRRIIGQEGPIGDQKAIPAIPLWGLYETILTKKCINEAVENFFASPRDDIELIMKLSRRDLYPRLHIELAPIYHDLRIQAAQFEQNAITPFAVGSKRWRFDDLLRTEDSNNYMPSSDYSMQSMESRSASMCCAHSSDATTARSPSYDYLSSAYSYLVAFVKYQLPYVPTVLFFSSFLLSVIYLSVSDTESKSGINKEQQR